MSVIFFGTPDFAVPSLQALLASGEGISLIVTQPDKRKGRGHKLSQPPVKIAALNAGLAVLQPSSLKDKIFMDRLLSIQPEFIIVVAYGRILTDEILALPIHGCINVHASLLPKYRGAAPIQWAIINGEKKTGITTMIVTKKLDTGPVLLQREIEISDSDTAETLGKKLADTGASLLIETLRGMRGGSIKPVPQTGEATYVPVIKKTDGLIDWSKSASEICNFIRGMQPWPGAYCTIGGETVKILKAKTIEGHGSPGVMANTGNEKLAIGAGNGLVSVEELQPAGKKRMSASAFIQGRKLCGKMGVR